MKIEELVQGVMNHARDNYNSDGWDYIYECWDSSELEAELEGLTSLKSAIKRMGKIAKDFEEQRSDIQGEIF